MNAGYLLSLVSKVLFDTRFLELKRENEAVKRGDLVWRQWPLDYNWYSTYKTQCEGLERLALVSKVFVDTRLLELKRENERLKLELFWRTYSERILHEELYKFHSTRKLVHCWCVSCVKHGRSHLDQDETEYYAALPVSQTRRCKPCQYRAWFEEFIKDMDMEFTYGADYGVDAVHFRFMDAGAGHWFWVYASRLYKSRSVTDPDLRKLEWIFENLRVMTNFS